jgi:hypothetical protein
VAQNSPRLILLSVQRCPRVADEGAVALANACFEVMTIYFRTTPTLPSLYIVGFAFSLDVQLEKVYFSNTKITEVGAISLFKHCDKLVVLQLDSCRSVPREIRYKINNHMSMGEAVPDIRTHSFPKIFEQKHVTHIQTSEKNDEMQHCRHRKRKHECVSNTGA